MKPRLNLVVIGLHWLLSFCFVATAFGQKSEKPFHDPFEDGCCLNPEFHRPVQVSRSTISSTRLAAALNCATNNEIIGGSSQLAKSFGDPKSLHIAYFSGTYMPGEKQPGLTIAVYSTDGRHGFLFDMSQESRKFSVWNVPELLRNPRQWRVGEIDGGLWSYTRLWYLAQEVGSRPRTQIPVSQIAHARPESCYVMSQDQSNWPPHRH